MTAPSKKTVPSERIHLGESDDGLIEFAPEHWNEPSLLLRGAPAHARASSIHPDAILGVDERTVWPAFGSKGLIRGVALASAGLAILAVAIAVLQLPVPASQSAAAPNLRPPPASAATPNAQSVGGPEQAPVPSPTAVAPSPIAAAPTPLPAAPVPVPKAPSSTPEPSSVPAPAAAVAEPARPQSDRRAIELALDRYRDTFNGLDAKDLYRNENQHVSFDTCEIEIGGSRAEARCRGTARYVSRVGSGDPRIEARQWRFGLRQRDGGWAIDQVEAQ